jgi:hypothetical protein
MSEGKAMTAERRARLIEGLEQVLDAYERRRAGFPLDYETETAIVDAARAALGPRCTCRQPLGPGHHEWDPMCAIVAAETEGR